MGYGRWVMVGLFSQPRATEWNENVSLPAPYGGFVERSADCGVDGFVQSI